MATTARSFWCVFSLGLLLNSFALAEEETHQERIERLRRELEAAEKVASEEAEKKATSEISDVEIPIDALVVVSSERSEGSGFIAEIRGRSFFVTNIHVLGAARGATFKNIPGRDLALSPIAFLSKHRDIAIVPIFWDGPSLKISSLLDFQEIEIGNAVTVMGNSSGARVATRLSGDIRGIGPDEIEVSAKFVPGNSGSPIVHDELGVVVGVASYMRDLSSKSKWTEDSELADIRRFGYRIDGEIEWERVSLEDLYEQGAVYNKFEDRTKVMQDISYMMENESTLMTGYRDHETLGYLFKDINSDFSWNRGTSSASNVILLRKLIDRMLNELQSDLTATDRTLTLNFYRKSYLEMASSREQIIRSLRRFREARLE
ncbi:MAG: trypsin-like peptidase domain-containing protein [Verrucomicrobiota bacterium]